MQDLILIVGYRGVGKTSSGKKLADSLGYSFYDTDILIEQKRGSDIAEIVKQEGWQQFRACEKEVLSELKKVRRAVVSTGGGAVLHRQEWELLQELATIFWLSADEQTILARIDSDEKSERQRPALTGNGHREEVKAVLQERLPLYRAVSHYCIDTASLDVDGVASEMEMILRKVGRSDGGE